MSNEITVKDFAVFLGAVILVTAGVTTIFLTADIRDDHKREAEPPVDPEYILTNISVCDEVVNLTFQSGDVTLTILIYDEVFIGLDLVVGETYSSEEIEIIRESEIEKDL